MIYKRKHLIYCAFNVTRLNLNCKKLKCAMHNGIRMGFRFTVKIDTKAVITIHIQHHFNKVKNSNERIVQTKDFSTSY